MINLKRIDDNWIDIENKFGVDAKIIANSKVLVDKTTYQEIDDFLASR